MAAPIAPPTIAPTAAAGRLPAGRGTKATMATTNVSARIGTPIAVPGMTPEVVFFPTRTGQFELACAELCGLAHYRMRGTFNVVSPKEFTEWLRKQ